MLDAPSVVGMRRERETRNASGSMHGDGEAMEILIKSNFFLIFFLIIFLIAEAKELSVG